LRKKRELYSPVEVPKKRRVYFHVPEAIRLQGSDGFKGPFSLETRQKVNVE
jgi:hypothetical protein